jgi:hypothetical protein
MAGLNERRMGGILTSLSLTQRTCKNSGYVLQLERSDRERIHANVRDYGVQPLSNVSLENCEMCSPRPVTPVPANLQTEVPKEKCVHVEDSTGECGEHSERNEHPIQIDTCRKNDGATPAQVN